MIVQRGRDDELTLVAELPFCLKWRVVWPRHSWGHKKCNLRWVAACPLLRASGKEVLCNSSCPYSPLQGWKRTLLIFPFRWPDLNIAASNSKAMIEHLGLSRKYKSIWRAETRGCEGGGRKQWRKDVGITSETCRFQLFSKVLKICDCWPTNI